MRRRELMSTSLMLAILIFTDVGWSQTTRPVADSEIARTERIATEFAGKKEGRAAYIRLGAIGSPESLAAIARVEAARAKTRLGSITDDNTPVDTDRDGVADATERLYALDPAKADTDGDGLNDGEDPCPDLPLDPNAVDDEETQIIRRAIYAEQVSGRRILLSNLEPFFGDATKMRPVHFKGLEAQVFYRYDRARLDDQFRFTMQLGWTVPEIRDTQATVKVWVGVSGGSTETEYKLRKISGQWYVVAEADRWIIG